MKNVIRFAVAGAMLAGYATAQAQSLPSTNASDLWLFVSDQAAGTSFAEDTGVTVASLMPQGSLLPADPTSATTTLSTHISANFTVPTTSALTAYINAANAAGQTLEWGVEGANFNGVTSAKGNGKPGGIVGVFNNVGTPSALNNTSQSILSGLQTSVNGFNSDLQFWVLPGNGSTQAGYVAGGQTYKISLGNNAGNVWGAGAGNIPGSTDLYGQLPNQAGMALGQATTLYGLTGNSDNGGQNQSYVLGTNLTLGTDGKLTVSSVPLPAAVFLFGSGLLGLFGVGRRRSAAV